MAHAKFSSRQYALIADAIRESATSGDQDHDSGAYCVMFVLIREFKKHDPQFSEEMFKVAAGYPEFLAKVSDYLL